MLKVHSIEREPMGWHNSRSSVNKGKDYTEFITFFSKICRGKWLARRFTKLQLPKLFFFLKIKMWRNRFIRIWSLADKQQQLRTQSYIPSLPHTPQCMLWVGGLLWDTFCFRKMAGSGPHGSKKWDSVTVHYFTSHYSTLERERSQPHDFQNDWLYS